MGAGILIVICFLISWLAARWLVPFMINWYRDRNLLVEDMNKFDRPKVPSLGGLGVVLAFILSMSVGLAGIVFFEVSEININFLLPGLLSVVIVAFVGFVDDVLFFPIRPIKPLLAFFASIPMIAVSYGLPTTLRIPILEDIPLGLFYPLVIIPLIIIFSSNALNVMADFDGLAPGNGLIMCAALFGCAMISDQPASMLIFAALGGSLLVMYFYNRYPARLFIGNVGTLFYGCVFAIGAVIGNLKLSLLILLIPYIVHFILQERIVLHEKSLTARPRERGIPQYDGTLRSQYQKAFGLTHLIMQKLRRVTEKKLVYSLYIIEIFFAIGAVMIHYQRNG